MTNEKKKVANNKATAGATKKSGGKASSAASGKAAASSNSKTIAIAILATALTCLVVVLGVLLCTGVMKFGSAEGQDEVVTQGVNTSGDSGNGGKYGTGTDKSGKKESGKTAGNGIVDNPNPRVKESGTLAGTGDLEFYLPKQFEASGKNKDGAFTYNLVNDDGWAQVLVYAERSSLTPARFLTEKVSPYLEITDADYQMNGTSWVQAENATSLAYATKLDGKIYAVYYAVKLDSDATAKAMQMIPKTLYMKRIYQD